MPLQTLVSAIIESYVCLYYIYSICHTGQIINADKDLSPIIQKVVEALEHRQIPWLKWIITIVFETRYVQIKHTTLFVLKVKPVQFGV